jgi:peptidoglycan/LPS O-acetylase OafA/YrhL
MYWLVTTAKVLIVLSVPAVMFHHHPTPQFVLASYALFPTLDAEGLVRPIHGVGWTLFHEMYFYYVFSFALLIRRSPLVVCGVIIGGAFALSRFITPVTAFEMPEGSKAPSGLPQAALK